MRVIHNDTEHGLVIEVPTWLVQCVADPTDMWPWASPRVAATLEWLRSMEPIDEPLPEFGADSAAHLRRIAHFVQNPDMIDAIDMDVWPGYDWWPIIDGNHRLYAAIVSRQPTVLVSISGDVTYAAELLGIDPMLFAA